MSKCMAKVTQRGPKSAFYSTVLLLTSKPSNSKSSRPKSMKFGLCAIKDPRNNSLESEATETLRENFGNFEKA